MTEQEPPPGDRTASTPLAAALADLRPYVVAVGAVGLLGAPAEVVVPIVRRGLGRPGVSFGPGVANLANGLVAVAVTRWFRHRPEQWARLRSGQMPVWAPAAVLVHLAVSPAVVALGERAVVLRRRTPLWGAAFSPIGLLQAALLLGALARARRATPRGGRRDS